MNTHTWSRLLDVVIPGRGPVIGTSEQVGRVFMVCRRSGCGRVVPYWNLVISKRTKRQRVGCKCGSGDVSPMTIPQWRGWWWYLVRGKLIRGLLLRKPDTDPRMPWQVGTHAT